MRKPCSPRSCRATKKEHLRSPSVIDAVAKDKVVAGRVPVVGVAWAGDRAMSKAESQVDDGLREPPLLLSPLGPLTWVAATSPSGRCT